MSDFIAQESFLQQLDGADSFDNWTIDGTQCVVRYRIDRFFGESSPCRRTQIPLRQQPDGPDSYGDRAIDSAQGIVCCLVVAMC